MSTDATISITSEDVCRTCSLLIKTHKFVVRSDFSRKFGDCRLIEENHPDHVGSSLISVLVRTDMLWSQKWKLVMKSLNVDLDFDCICKCSKQMEFRNSNACNSMNDAMEDCWTFQFVWSVGIHGILTSYVKVTACFFDWHILSRMYSLCITTITFDDLNSKVYLSISSHIWTSFHMWCWTQEKRHLVSSIFQSQNCMKYTWYFPFSDCWSLTQSHTYTNNVNTKHFLWNLIKNTRKHASTDYSWLGI